MCIATKGKTMVPISAQDATWSDVHHFDGSFCGSWLF
jgi:hypothetical protein